MRAGFGAVLALTLAGAGCTGGQAGRDQTPPEPPPPLIPEPPPGGAAALYCEPFLGDQPDTACWSCTAPDGQDLGTGCASLGEPVPPGIFCTADASSGDQICVLCCDPEGRILLQECSRLDPPLEVTCSEYYSDDYLSCITCNSSEGWQVADQCYLLQSSCWSDGDCPEGQTCGLADPGQPGICVQPQADPRPVD